MVFSTKFFPLLILVFLTATSCNNRQSGERKDIPRTCQKNYWHDTSTYNMDGDVHAFIEIPAGSDKKYELNKTTGKLEWEKLSSGKNRRIRYLPYPANYGMIPRTYLSPDSGGDGDPLDIIVLGPSVEQGSIVSCRVIAVLMLTDSGENDDKLIAVMDNTAFSGISGMDKLNSEFPGVADIIQTWFLNYKANGEMSSSGFGGKEEASQILHKASKTYNKHFSKKNN